MSVLHFDMAAKLRKGLSDWRKQAEQQAAQTARRVEDDKYRERYNERHNPDSSGPQRA